MTFSLTTLSIMTFSIRTLSIVALNIAMLSVLIVAPFIELSLVITYRGVGGEFSLSAVWAGF